MVKVIHRADPPIEEAENVHYPVSFGVGHGGRDAAQVATGQLIALQLNCESHSLVFALTPENARAVAEAILLILAGGPRHDA